MPQAVCFPKFSGFKQGFSSGSRELQFFGTQARALVHSQSGVQSALSEQLSPGGVHSPRCEQRSKVAQSALTSQSLIGVYGSTQTPPRLRKQARPSTQSALTEHLTPGSPAPMVGRSMACGMACVG
jgi:hypothetical protein